MRHRNKCRQILWLAFFLTTCSSRAQQTNAAPATLNPNEILSGHAFASKFERDVFFLKAVRDRYSSSWVPLLDANINLREYAGDPPKMLRFITELGSAMQNQNDSDAITSLGRVVSDPGYFTNADAYHPELITAAAQAMIQTGTNGEKALAAALNEGHYRQDPASLEELVKAVGREKPAGPELDRALAAIAFQFSVANGGCYPRLTTEATAALLHLPDGPSLAREHLKSAAVFDDPGRFQSVVDGIAAAHSAELATNLSAIAAHVKTKLGTLTNSPGAYRDDLQELDARLQKVLQNPDAKKP
jgi:hypothetical protein